MKNCKCYLNSNWMPKCSKQSDFIGEVFNGGFRVNLYF